jgi:hypothetical protein
MPGESVYNYANYADLAHGWLHAGTTFDVEIAGFSPDEEAEMSEALQRGARFAFLLEPEVEQ